MNYLCVKHNLKILYHIESIPNKDDFQIFILSNNENVPLHPYLTASEQDFMLFKQRTQFLKSWSNLDENLENIIGSQEIILFGGGEMAALLRVFAPRVWQDVKFIIMDKISDAWPLGKAIFEVSEMVARDYHVLIATAPNIHGAIEERLKNDGWAVIMYDYLFLSNED